MLLKQGRAAGWKFGVVGAVPESYLLRYEMRAIRRVQHAHPNRLVPFREMVGTPHKGVVLTSKDNWGVVVRTHVAPKPRR